MPHGRTCPLGPLDHEATLSVYKSLLSPCTLKGMSTSDQRPGFLIIERYMPSASATEREEAYASLREYVAILMRIEERVKRECDSTNRAGRLRLNDDTHV